MLLFISWRVKERYNLVTMTTKRVGNGSVVRMFLLLIEIVFISRRVKKGYSLVAMTTKRVGNIEEGKREV